MLKLSFIQGLFLPLVAAVLAPTSTTSTSLPSNVQTVWGLCSGVVLSGTVLVPWTKTICENGSYCATNLGPSYVPQCLPTTTTTTITTKSLPITTPKVTTTTPKSSTIATTTPFSTCSTFSSTKAVTTPSTLVAPKWGQCGGIGWTGPTICPSGTKCSPVNDFYFQCV